MIGYPGAKFKKFKQRSDAEAFIEAVDNKVVSQNFKRNQEQIDSFFGKDTPPIQRPTKSPVKSVCYVYTDGSCENNGKVGAKAGYGVYITHRLCGRVPDTYKQTNNAAELLGFIRGMEAVKDIREEVVLMTDSEYVIKCISSYGDRCAQNHWVKDIPNKDLVKRAYELYNASRVSVKHVRAHTNGDDRDSQGNHIADQLANDSLSIE